MNDSTVRSLVDCGLKVRRLMRQHGISIAALAERMGCSQGRVRQVRMLGSGCYGCAADWFEGITGVCDFSPSEYDNRAGRTCRHRAA